MSYLDGNEFVAAACEGQSHTLCGARSCACTCHRERDKEAYLAFLHHGSWHPVRSTLHQVGYCMGDPGSPLDYDSVAFLMGLMDEIRHWERRSGRTFDIPATVRVFTSYDEYDEDDEEYNSDDGYWEDENLVYLDPVRGHELMDPILYDRLAALSVNSAHVGMVPDRAVGMATRWFVHFPGRGFMTDFDVWRAAQ